MQQDWLLRMIQQISSFVAGIKKLRQKGEWAAVHATVEDGIGRYVGLNPSLVHAISEDDLIQLLSTRSGVNLDRWWALAELLREEAIALDAQGDSAGAERAFAKSLRLSLEVLNESEEVPSYLDVTELEMVIERMLDKPLTMATRRELTGYLVATVRYDQAENVVLWAVDEDRAEAAYDAHAFYERLSKIDDATLEAGGLSRDEVHDGLIRFTDATGSLPAPQY
ncbi:MAG TPA: DUF6483 family protein [Thermomicrobiales bacterium]|nr:DUF6483 family protein [Thermomicrobiales bacterium]